MTKLRTAAVGLGYFPNKAIGLTALSLLIYPEAQHTLQALRGTQMCVRASHQVQLSTRGTYFWRKKWVKQRRRDASCFGPLQAKAPALCLPSANGHSHRAHLLFFWVERKNNGFVAAVPGPPARRGLPLRAEDATGLPKQFLALEGGRSESCPRATSQRDQSHVESPEHQPLLPRTWTQGDLCIFHTIMKEKNEQTMWKDAGTDLTLESSAGGEL